ncbi:hypothetical protein SLA2020_378070 [Shorea laevis]
MAEEVLLFGVWASPFTRRVEVALKLKGVEKAPVLVHNGKPIAESLVILEYIDDTWQGYPILPKDPYERAAARFWAKFVDDKYVPAAAKAFFGEEKEREKSVEEACEVLKFLENELKEKRFFGGENIGLVDIAANVIGFWLGACEEASGVELLTRDKFPKLRNWVDEFVSSSVIKENLPPRDKVVAFLRDRFGIANCFTIDHEFIVAYNSQLVPVLVHSGKPITESQVILEYIDETWQGYSILPKDPYERAVARFWAKFIDDKCFPAILKACWGEKNEHEKGVEEVDEILKALENELAEKSFFGGEKIGLVDIVCNVIGFSLRVYEEAAGVELLTREKFPRVCRWIDEFVCSSVIKENLPPKDKLIAYLRGRFGTADASK